MINRWWKACISPTSPSIRKTDVDWQSLGEKEPYFGVFSHPRYLRENLTDDVEADFFESGVREIDIHLARLRNYFGAFEPRSALDFGCGVGRLTRALARVTGNAVGIDVSDGMLLEARKHTIPGASFEKARPDFLFDWIVSIIVFQHIAPERGYAIVADLLTALKPGGCVTLHFTFWRDAEHRSTAGTRLTVENEKIAYFSSAGGTDHPVGHISMFDYDLSVIAALLNRANVNDFYVVHTDHGGFHGGIVFGRRAL